jgi:hypothetical protein
LAATPVDVAPYAAPIFTSTEQIAAGYGTAVHILDTATRSRSGSSPSAVLSGLSLPGYTLTWMHAGTPETASLH